MELIIKPLYTEEDVQDALNDIANGKSMRKASADWGVPRTTLTDRISGRVSRAEAKALDQRLSPIQEQRLTD